MYFLAVNYYILVLILSLLRHYLSSFLGVPESDITVESSGCNVSSTRGVGYVSHRRMVATEHLCNNYSRLTSSLSEYIWIVF